MHCGTVHPKEQKRWSKLAKKETEVQATKVKKEIPKLNTNRALLKKSLMKNADSPTWSQEESIDISSQLSNSSEEESELEQFINKQSLAKLKKMIRLKRRMEEPDDPREPSDTEQQIKKKRITLASADSQHKQPFKTILSKEKIMETVEDVFGVCKKEGVNKDRIFHFRRYTRSEEVPEELQNLTVPNTFRWKSYRFEDAQFLKEFTYKKDRSKKNNCLYECYIHNDTESLLSGSFKWLEKSEEELKDKELMVQGGLLFNEHGL